MVATDEHRSTRIRADEEVNRRYTKIVQMKSEEIHRNNYRKKNTEREIQKEKYRERNTEREIQREKYREMNDG